MYHVYSAPFVCIYHVLCDLLALVSSILSVTEWGDVMKWNCEDRGFVGKSDLDFEHLAKDTLFASKRIADFVFF